MIHLTVRAVIDVIRVLTESILSTIRAVEEFDSNLVRAVEEFGKRPATKVCEVCGIQYPNLKGYECPIPHTTERRIDE